MSARRARKIGPGVGSDIGPKVLSEAGPLQGVPWRPLLAADGRGVRIAVVDSGIAPGHPHVGGALDGASFDLGPEGEVVQGTDTSDRIGHGTACAAAIREILPQAEILPVRVFRDRLEATAAQAARAILWAIDQGAQVVNLSLAAFLHGRRAEEALRSACRSAFKRHVAVLAARPRLPPKGRRRDASSLEAWPEVIPVGSDLRCPPGTFFSDGRRPPGFLASPLARPVPGIPADRNFRGPSLATARMSGFAGKILQIAGPLPVPELREALARWAERNARFEDRS